MDSGLMAFDGESRATLETNAFAVLDADRISNVARNRET
jgi:hypothetical protein